MSDERGPEQRLYAFPPEVIDLIHKGVLRQWKWWCPSTGTLTYLERCNHHLETGHKARQATGAAATCEGPDPAVHVHGALGATRRRGVGAARGGILDSAHRPGSHRRRPFGQDDRVRLHPMRHLAAWDVIGRLLPDADEGEAAYRTMVALAGDEWLDLAMVQVATDRATLLPIFDPHRLVLR